MNYVYASLSLSLLTFAKLIVKYGRTFDAFIYFPTTITENIVKWNSNRKIVWSRLLRPISGKIQPFLKIHFGRKKNSLIFPIWEQWEKNTAKNKKRSMGTNERRKKTEDLKQSHWFSCATAFIRAETKDKTIFPATKSNNSDNIHTKAAGISPHKWLKN